MKTGPDLKPYHNVNLLLFRILKTFNYIHKKDGIEEKDMSAVFIYVLADYGDLHDLAFAEVKQKLIFEAGDLDVRISTFSVPAFDTVATGFALAQTAVNSALGKQHKFYVNTAPRKDDLSPRVKNAGEGFAYVRLHNDVEVCAVNSGYSLSFVKQAARDIRLLNCEKAGSQFRSRDVFPPAFGKIMHGNYEELGEDITEQIPSPPRSVVCYTDGYGNMKCAIAPDEIDHLKGQDISLSINGKSHVARVSDGIFGVADGQLCLSTGSSGWTLPDGTKKQFCEVVQRGGSAADTFGRPAGGAAVKWREV